MNYLTILIYLTQIIPQIGVFCIIASIFGSAYCIIRVIAHFCTEDEVKKGWRDVPISLPPKKHFVWVFLGFLIFALVPDRTTMILMASSEVAQKIVTSDKMNQVIDKNLDPAIDLLNVWIVEKKAELLKTDKK